MAKDKSDPEPKYEIGERVQIVSSVYIVKSRQLKKGEWFYVCASENPRSKAKPMPFPEKRLKKPDPPAIGRAIVSRPR